ncbi:MAG: hypothetical protein P8168_05075 [Deltaproteobacteria bacterium]|jgi:hypothetical protein
MDSINGIIALLVGLQFAAFGWRINREISVGDEERKTWIPLADFVNIIMLFSTIICCIIIPLMGFDTLRKPVFIAAAILIAFHPMTTAGHYGLLTRRGRKHYLTPEGDWPYKTGEEYVSFILSLIITAVFVGLYMVP